MHAGQAAAVTGNDAAQREQEARQCDDRAVLGLRGVGRVAPQRVVIADAVRVVTDAVARGFVVPRFNRVGDGHADAAAKVGKTFFGDLGKAIRSEEHTSELQSLMRSSYASICLQTKKKVRTY